LAGGGAAAAGRPRPSLAGGEGGGGSLLLKPSGQAPPQHQGWSGGAWDPQDGIFSVSHTCAESDRAAQSL
jgi:hypothetical protein